MNLIKEIHIPTFIFYQLISAIVICFLIWRNKKLFRVRKEVIFDFLLVYFVIPIVIGRVIYLLENFTLIVQGSWSVYPYYYDPGAQRIWFKQMPWMLIKFWDGEINFSAVMLGSMLSTFLYFYRKQADIKALSIIIRAAIFGQIIQLFGFFLGGNYLGKVTDSFIGYEYSGYDGMRYPLQLMEISVLLALLLLSSFLKKLKKDQIVTGLYFFTSGWLGIVIESLKDNSGLDKNINLMQFVYLGLVFLGIFQAVFALQKGESIANVGKNNLSVGKEISNPSYNQKRDSRSHFRFRDYKSSYSTYKQAKPSTLASIKRKLFSRKKTGR